jgi:APA family basic amino acid/polyamine antiporter
MAAMTTEAVRNSPSPSDHPGRQIGLGTATYIVVANMIGTGVFTSLGFQVLGTKSVFALLMLWLLGGVYALCGALCYGELAAAMPHSGGEYRFLSNLYHPAAGFVAGCISATVGFAAPVAVASMALGRYLSKVFPTLPPTVAALLVAGLVTIIHLGSVKARTRLQGAATGFKVLLIVGLILCGLLLVSGGSLSLRPGAADWAECFSPAFATSLVYVTYSYSGWNASVYLASEVKDPARNIPRSLLLGTGLVTVLYVLVNYVFLLSTPMSELAGQLEVGYLAGTHIFGSVGGSIMALLISIGLVSAISSMTWAGPRVLWALSGEFRVFAPFSRLNRHGVPTRAVGLQLGIVVLLILTSTFEAVIAYLGFTLSLCTFMAVMGVYILRRRRPAAEGFRAWGYPVTPAVFLLITAWMLGFLLWKQPKESMIGVGTVAAGLVLYLLSARKTAGEDQARV